MSCRLSLLCVSNCVHASCVPSADWRLHSRSLYVRSDSSTTDLNPALRSSLEMRGAVSVADWISNTVVLKHVKQKVEDQGSRILVDFRNHELPQVATREVDTSLYQLLMCIVWYWYTVSTIRYLHPALAQQGKLQMYQSLSSKPYGIPPIRS